MSDSGNESDSPLSQLSIEDDEIVWANGSLSDTDFIVLHHPLLNARSLPSTLSDFSGQPVSDGDLSSAFYKLSLHHPGSLLDSSSTTAETESDLPPSEDQMHTDDLEGSASSIASSRYCSGTSTPTASYDDASAFISSFISSPAKGNDAQLNLLRALIIELGLRSPNASDLPCTLTSARKILKAEAHVNIKEYVTTRHKGQEALRRILKPSKKALRKDIKNGNRTSLRWVKQHGLQILLINCFT